MIGRHQEHHALAIATVRRRAEEGAVRSLNQRADGTRAVESHERVQHGDRTGWRHLEDRAEIVSPAEFGHAIEVAVRCLHDRSWSRTLRPTCELVENCEGAVQRHFHDHALVERPSTRRRA